MNIVRERQLYRNRLFALALGVLASCSAAGAAAHDQDEARRAVEAGDIRPLADILNAAADKLPGKVVGVKLEHERGRWVYEFRVVDANGRLFEVYVDARSGDIERTKEK